MLEAVTEWLGVQEILKDAIPAYTATEKDFG